MNKRRIFLCFSFVLPVILLYQCERITPGDTVTFSDEVFFQALCDQGVDRNKDGVITLREAEEVRRLDFLMTGLENLSGLEAFVNLDTLIMKMETLESLDLSGNPGLKYLECTMGYLRSVDLSRNLSLEEINLENNLIDSLCLPGGTSLKTFRCGYNLLKALDVSSNPGLEILSCNNNELTTLDLSFNTGLIRMISCGNRLSFLDVSANTRITTLGIDNMPSLEEVCVWTLPFPPDGVNILMGFSPNVVFVTGCNSASK